MNRMNKAAIQEHQKRTYICWVEWVTWIWLHMWSDLVNVHMDLSVGWSVGRSVSQSVCLSVHQSVRGTVQMMVGTEYWIAISDKLRSIFVWCTGERLVEQKWQLQIPEKRNLSPTAIESLLDSMEYFSEHARTLTCYCLVPCPLRYLHHIQAVLWEATPFVETQSICYRMRGGMNAPGQRLFEVQRHVSQRVHYFKISVCTKRINNAILRVPCNWKR